MYLSRAHHHQEHQHVYVAQPVHAPGPVPSPPQAVVQPGRAHSSTCECSDCDKHGEDCGCGKCEKRRRATSPHRAGQASPHQPGQCSPYYCPAHNFNSYDQSSAGARHGSNALGAYLAQAAQQTSNFMGYLANGKW